MLNPISEISIPQENVLSFLSPSLLPGSESNSASKFQQGQTNNETLFSFYNQTNESIQAATVTSVISKMSGSEVTVTSAQNAPNTFSKQLRSKFTPIRPKGSPNKTSPQKDVKAETNKDSRRVSAILKEKREKQKAEAGLKSQPGLQTGMQMTSLPFVNSVSFGSQQLTLQGGQSTMAQNVPSKEVVIIVNNQSNVQSIFGQNLQYVSNVLSQSSVSQGSVKAQPNTGENMGNRLNSSSANGGGVTKGSNCKKVNANEMKGVNSPKLNLNDQSLDIPDTLTDKDEVSKAVGNETMDVTNYRSPNNAQSLENQVENRLPVESAANVNRSDDSYLVLQTVDDMWSETPSKIAKMNITSPYRSESVCSIDKETSIRVARPESVQRPDSVQRPESVLSRPESACSFGRETPGGRKRKCSEVQARKDFKRLNSTGEEIMEDIHNTSMVLSPDNEYVTTDSTTRRSKSCTKELEEDGGGRGRNGGRRVQKPSSIALNSPHQHKSEQSLLQGLQSPDISSVEKDALLESFPNSILAMKPQRKTQVASVGISALKQSKPSLDQRVKNYFEAKKQMKGHEGHEGRENKEIVGLTFTNVKNVKMSEQKAPQAVAITRSKSRNDSVGNSGNAAVFVSDRGKPYVRPLSAASKFDLENSDFPDSLADWVIEQKEKDKGKKDNRPATTGIEGLCGSYQDFVTNVSVPDFNFETSAQTFIPDRPKSVSFTLHSPQSQNVAAAQKLQSSTCTKDDNNTFTVPKAPPISAQRHKDHNSLKLNPDNSAANQRCHSLPLFISPAASPVSPVTSPVSRFHGSTRASSMSPRAPGHTAMELSPDALSPNGSSVLSPQGGITSPLRFSSPSQIQGQGPFMAGSNSSQGQGLVGKDGNRNVNTYLRKIQHSLQMPVDPQMKATDKQKFTLNLGQSHHQHGLNHPQIRSRESSLEVDDRFLSKTPFSDSGYQSNSSDPSPILNSTPISAQECVDMCSVGLKLSVAESPVTMEAESPITMMSDYNCIAPNVSSQQIPVRQNLIGQQQLSASMASDLPANQMQGHNANALRSSIHSAFIPIQGSHQDTRYVSPIKPTVSNANVHENMSQDSENSLNLFIDPHQSIYRNDVMMTSPKSSDPPPYEIALQQLKERNSERNKELSNQAMGHSNSKNSTLGKQFIDEQQSYGSLTIGTMGPFSSKLLNLSKKSSSVESETSDSLNLLSPESDGFVGDFANIPDSVIDSLLNKDLKFDQSKSVAKYRQNLIGQHKSHEQTSITNDSASSFASHHYPSSQSVLQNPDSAINMYNLSQFSMGIPVSHSVLNIDPSFHNLPHSGALSSNENSENMILSSMHHNTDSFSTQMNEMDLLVNKPIFSLQKQLAMEQINIPPEIQTSLVNTLQIGEQERIRTKNVLIGGKGNPQSHSELFLANQDALPDKDLLEGFPLDSLKDFEGQDFAEFDMFN